MSPWFPRDGSRQKALFVVGLLGITPFLLGREYELLWIWVLLPFLSPRVMGGIAYGLGWMLALITGRR